MTDREIYEEVRGSLMRFAASLVGPDNADDVVSESVVRALRRGPLASLHNPRAYLMQAVLNIARDRGRRLTRERAWEPPSR
jgi:DNA-directed RNA polymerase specialized sigma24 family protein